jgi:hypothetical protein
MSNGFLSNKLKGPADRIRSEWEARNKLVPWLGVLWAATSFGYVALNIHTCLHPDQVKYYGLYYTLEHFAPKPIVTIVLYYVLETLCTFVLIKLMMPRSTVYEVVFRSSAFAALSFVLTMAILSLDYPTFSNKPSPIYYRGVDGNYLVSLFLALTKNNVMLAAIGFLTGQRTVFDRDFFYALRLGLVPTALYTFATWPPRFFDQPHSTLALCGWFGFSVLALCLSSHRVNRLPNVVQLVRTSFKREAV